VEIRLEPQANDGRGDGADDGQISNVTTDNASSQYVLPMHFVSDMVNPTKVNLLGNLSNVMRQ
jgi:hypothetical protein